jgi:Cu/Ag efflux protein CusF
VRGEVVGLPDPASPTVGFYVRHEAIDDFKAADGTIAGMDAMTMQFPLTDPSLLQGVNAGDKVELTYRVDWHGDPMQDVTVLRKLPPDTELVFREAEPAN